MARPTTKPAYARGWPTKRRPRRTAASCVDRGTQTELSINGDGKWVSDVVLEKEINPYVFSDDDGDELGVDLSEGEVKAIL